MKWIVVFCILMASYVTQARRRPPVKRPSVTQVKQKTQRAVQRVTTQIKRRNVFRFHRVELENLRKAAIQHPDYFLPVLKAVAKTPGRINSGLKADAAVALVRVAAAVKTEKSTSLAGSGFKETTKELVEIFNGTRNGMWGRYTVIKTWNEAWYHGKGKAVSKDEIDLAISRLKSKKKLNLTKAESNHLHNMALKHPKTFGQFVDWAGTVRAPHMTPMRKKIIKAGAALAKAVAGSSEGNHRSALVTLVMAKELLAPQGVATLNQRQADIMLDILIGHAREIQGN